MIVLRRSLYLLAAALLLLCLPAWASALDDAAYWLREGNSCLANGSFQQASRSFDNVIRLTPQSPAAWGGKGIALSRMGRYGIATLCFDFA